MVALVTQFKNNKSLVLLEKNVFCLKIILFCKFFIFWFLI